MTSQISKGHIGLAGEFRVASELLRRNHRASVTFGNEKSTDIFIAQENNRYLKVEVKTSKNGKKFLTRYYQKYKNPAESSPDIWILYLPREDISAKDDRFFIFSHAHLGELQLIVNKGVKPEKGVDNVTVKKIEEHSPEAENAWCVIDEA